MIPCTGYIEMTTTSEEMHVPIMNALMKWQKRVETIGASAMSTFLI